MIPLDVESLARKIAATSEPELTSGWPVERLKLLQHAGVFRWGLPVEFGGQTLTGSEMLEAYVELSRMCLTTAFVLTQRDAACHRLVASPNAELRQKLLPELCRGTIWATVGISHLSTSRQHWTRPSVVATGAPDGFELTGEAPWVTGADCADLLVTGATLESGDQVLVAIPADRDGIVVGDPLKLLALNASRTGTVLLNRVAVRREEIVLGPLPQVMKVGATGGTGSLTTTAVAIGAASRTLDELQKDSTGRPVLVDAVNSLSGERDRLLADLRQAGSLPDASQAAGGAAPDDPQLTPERLRHRANSLVVRAAQAYVCASKGQGFVAGHPADRFVREAMFFHVWSCPMSVTTRTLTELTSVSQPVP